MEKAKFVDKGRIEEAKSISIVNLLQSIGSNPVKRSGDEFCYLSPLRKEKTPSFFVNPTKNRFSDFGGPTEFKGDVIWLFQLIHSYSFLEAVERLLKLDWPEITSFSFSSNLPQDQETPGIEITSVRPLQNSALLRYVIDRDISVDLARIYLKEIYYKCRSKSYFSLALKNDLGGYELRNKYFQGSTSPKSYSTIEGRANKELNLFEGFFDFLSCCQHHQVSRLGSTSLILNSLSLLDSAFPAISQFSRVRAFLDNDDPGNEAVQKLEKHGICVDNHSDTYKPYKDYNEFLTAMGDFRSG